MKTISFSAALWLTVMAVALPSVAQHNNREDIPTSKLDFLVLKDDNGKPVRNAAVIMHPVDEKGQQESGGMELKTDLNGKSSYDGIPYGMLRVQVLAHGYQTYGEDFQINQPNMAFTIKLKRPQKQYSVYDNHTSDGSGQTNQTPPPAKPPN